MNAYVLSELEALWSTAHDTGPLYDAYAEYKRATSKLSSTPTEILACYGQPAPSIIDTYREVFEELAESDPQDLWDGFIAQTLTRIGERRPGAVAKAILRYGLDHPLSPDLIAAIRIPTSLKTERDRLEKLRSTLESCGDADFPMLSAVVDALSTSRRGRALLEIARRTRPQSPRAQFIERALRSE